MEKQCSIFDQGSWWNIEWRHGERHSYRAVPVFCRRFLCWRWHRWLPHILWGRGIRQRRAVVLGHIRMGSTERPGCLSVCLQAVSVRVLPRLTPNGGSILAHNNMSTDATKTRLYILFSATERAVMHSYHLKSNIHSALLSKSITVSPAPSKCLLHRYIVKHATFSH